MRGLRINDSEILNSLVNSAFEEGVLVLKAGRNTLRFLPPLTITKEEMDRGFERLRGVFKKVVS
jgi:acetylornithine aminotransferase